MRDAEINNEVLRLGGELQAAKLEIKRLRQKLVPGTVENSEMPSPEPKASVDFAAAVE